jgi:hypothetical protein
MLVKARRSARLRAWKTLAGARSRFSSSVRELWGNAPCAVKRNRDPPGRPSAEIEIVQ